MRDIIFRGKNKKTGEWVYGYYYTLNEYHCIRNDNRRPEYIDCVVDAETVGQFTGVYDREMKPIYEGDIVLEYPKWNSKPFETKYLVTFRHGAFGIVDKADKFESFAEYSFLAEPSFIIIGNIYDNAELLEEEK